MHDPLWEVSTLTPSIIYKNFFINSGEGSGSIRDKGAAVASGAYEKGG